MDTNATCLDFQIFFALVFLYLIALKAGFSVTWFSQCRFGIQNYSLEKCGASTNPFQLLYEDIFPDDNILKHHKNVQNQNMTDNGSTKLWIGVLGSLTLRTV
jgi:hypothetical protein